ncbi:hypothetical protein OG604_01305 [Streptomyces sp. NBC_01231]|nr:hypothetical protein OG604_01305 [Streptomyces sp. NBC_01231]
MGLTTGERRDFRLLYGDPWQMVQDLLGHAQQLRSLLEDVPELNTGRRQRDETFARLAREAEGIQDVDDRLEGVA